MTMRRTAGLLLGTCALLVLAACGTRAPSAGGPAPTQASLPPGVAGSVPPVPGPTSTTTPPPATGAPTTTRQPTVNPAPPPTPAGPRTPVPARQITTQGMSAPPRDVQVTANGRTVVFAYPQSGCEHVTAMTGAQTPTAVTIQIQTLVSAQAGRLCPLIIRNVPLSAPLAA